MLPPFNDTRAVFLVVAHLPLFAGVIRPGVSTWLHARAAAPALALVPGAVVCSYTISTPLYSFLSLIAVGAVWLLAPGADLRRVPWLGPGLRRVGWAPALALLLGLGCLYPFARVADDPIASLALPPDVPLALGLGAVAVWLLLGHRLRGGRLPSAEAAAAIVLACAAVGLRRWVPSALGLACLVATPVFAVLAFRARRTTLAAGLAFASYGWVSRDDELLAVAGAALVVEAITAVVRAGATPDDPRAERRPWAVGTLTAVLFAASFLCRVGLQRGLDLRLIDHAAGAFGDPTPSELRLGLAIGWKFVAPELLIVWLFLRGLPRDLARGAAVLYVVASVMRVSTLALMLAVSRSSYWTSFRVLSDLPLAALMSLSAAIGLGALARADRVRPVTRRSTRLDDAEPATE